MPPTAARASWAAKGEAVYVGALSIVGYGCCFIFLQTFECKSNKNILPAKTKAFFL